MYQVKELLERIKSLPEKYKTFEEFLEDNPGAIESLHVFIDDYFEEEDFVANKNADERYGTI